MTQAVLGPTIFPVVGANGSSTFLALANRDARFVFSSAKWTAATKQFRLAVRVPNEKRIALGRNRRAVKLALFSGYGIEIVGLYFKNRPFTSFPTIGI